MEQLTDGFIVDGDGNVVYASSLVKNASLDYNPVLKTTCKMLNTGCDQPPIMVYGSHAYNGTDGITPLGYTEFMKLLEDGDGKELVFPVQGQSSSDFEDLSKAIAEAITYYSEETNPEGTVVDMFPNAQATYENPIMDCTGASIRFASTFNLENSATLVEICFIEGEDGRYIMHAWNPVFVSSPEDYQTESFLHDGTPGYGKYSPKIIETLLGGQAGKLIGYAEPSSGNFYGPSVIQLLNTYPVTAFNNKHVVEFDYPIELAQASDETSPTTTIAQKWTDTLVTMKDLYKFFNVTSLQELESKHRVYPTEQTG